MTTTIAPFGNHLADALEDDDRRWLASAAELVTAPAGALLSSPGKPPSHCYFPVDALLVVWNRFGSEGRPGLLQIAGRSRVAGHMTAFSWSYSDAWIETLASGRAWRVPTDELERRISSGNAALGLMLARVACATLTLNAIRTFCAQEHNIDRRLATLLLFLADQRGSNEIPLTHETIASLSGIRRPSVSHVLSSFQNAALIQTHRGHLEIVNGPALAATACACFDEATRLVRSVTGTSKS